jgi:hypothetical protein
VHFDTPEETEALAIKWNAFCRHGKRSAEFPGLVAGCIDGTHIRLSNKPSCPSDASEEDKKKWDPSAYFNYKHYYSIVLLAVGGLDKKIKFFVLVTLDVTTTHDHSKWPNSKTTWPNPNGASRPISSSWQMVPSKFVVS